jgi:hypothetical protein
MSPLSVQGHGLIKCGLPCRIPHECASHSSFLPRITGSSYVHMKLPRLDDYNVGSSGAKDHGQVNCNSSMVCACVMYAAVVFYTVNIMPSRICWVCVPGEEVNVSPLYM